MIIGYYRADGIRSPRNSYLSNLSSVQLGKSCHLCWNPSCRTSPWSASCNMAVPATGEFHSTCQPRIRQKFVGDGLMASKIMPPANKIFVVSYYIIPNPIRGSFFFWGGLGIDFCTTLQNMIKWESLKRCGPTLPLANVSWSMSLLAHLFSGWLFLRPKSQCIPVLVVPSKNSSHWLPP